MSILPPLCPDHGEPDPEDIKGLAATFTVQWEINGEVNGLCFYTVMLAVGVAFASQLDALPGINRADHSPEEVLAKAREFLKHNPPTLPSSN